VVTLAASAAAGQARAPQFEPVPAPPDVAKPPADATKTASGLASKVLAPGTGTATAKAEDFVTVHYTGWTTDGKMFDSSYARGAAATFPVNRVIKGWGEGVQLMVVGEKRRFWMPEPIAFAGMEGRPKGMVVFDIELLGFEAPPTQAPRPTRRRPAATRSRGDDPRRPPVRRRSSSRPGEYRGRARDAARPRPAARRERSSPVPGPAATPCAGRAPPGRGRRPPGRDSRA